MDAQNRHLYHDVLPPAYAIAQAQRKEVLNLGNIEIDIPPCKEVKDMLRGIKDEGLLHTYPNAQDELTENLYRAIHRYTNTYAGDVKIALTHGSDTAIRSIIDSYMCRSAAPVRFLTCQHTYPHFESFLKHHSPYRFMLERFESLSALQSALCRREDVAGEINSCDKTTVVYLPNPAMDGAFIYPNDLEPIMREHSKVVFVIDEAYYEFDNEHFKYIDDDDEDEDEENADPFKDCLMLRRSVVHGNLPNVITIRTFSKAFALASIRLGYMMGASEVIEPISRLLNAKDITTYSKSLALAALENPTHYLQHIRQMMCSNLAYVLSAIPNAWSGVSGPFFFVTFGSQLELEKACTHLLVQKNILIRNKHQQMPFTARVTLPSDRKVCERLVFAFESLKDDESKPEYDVVIWDMDGTLRKTCSSRETLRLPAKLRSTLGALHVIVTNNRHLPDVKRQLPFIQSVWCPSEITDDTESIEKQLGKAIMTVRVPPTLTWFKAIAAEYFAYESAPVLLISDDAVACDWRQMSELANDHATRCYRGHGTGLDASFTLPDVRFFAEWLRDHCSNPNWTERSQVIYIGKDSDMGVASIRAWLQDVIKTHLGDRSMDSVKMLVVGDSDCDWRLSQSLRCDFRKVTASDLETKT